MIGMFNPFPGDNAGQESKDFATSISMVTDSQTRIVTTELKNKDGQTLGQPQTIQLPEEVGKTSVKGTEYVIDGTTYTVGDNAEYFNNYSNNKAIGTNSHSEGENTTACGLGAHAEGLGTIALSAGSHAEGATTKASNYNSHAEGGLTIASGACSHAEGSQTQATGSDSHAEGSQTQATGNDSHAEGGATTASGQYSHAEGFSTIASSNNQHVQGTYNISDPNSTYSFIIGNGTADNARSNAFAIDWQGNIYQNNAQSGINIATALSTKADLENGVIPISQIPPAAIEKMVTVADDTARFALTTSDVQLGDTVKVTSTNKMYMVVDTLHLDSETGYQVYVAGRAAEAVADQNGNVIDTTYATKATTKTSWIGTAEQYAALQSDDYELYFVEEEES